MTFRLSQPILAVVGAGTKMEFLQAALPMGGQLVTELSVVYNTLVTETRDGYDQSPIN